MDNNDVGNAIVKQINNVLTAIDQEEEAIATKIAELEAQGYRIVEADQISTGDEPPQCAFYDWRTGEALWRGDPRVEHDNDNWYLIEHLVEDATETIKTDKVPGFSPMLLAVIEDMAGANEDEFRALLGRPTNATERGRPK